MAERRAPAGLAARGRRLWRDMGGADMPAGRRELLEEACRLVDRLETLDKLLRGDEGAWVRLQSRNESGSIVEVVVDKALSEARQQQIALKQVLGELRQGQAGAGSSRAERQAAAAGSARSPAGGAAGAGIIDLGARIAARRDNPAG